MRHWLSRREALQLGAATVVSAVAGARRSTAAAPSRMPRIDTHVHCFAGNGHARFPYHERAPYRPEAPATPEHLLDCMRAADVDYAVVVHPEPYQDDHRYFEHCLAVGNGKLKGTLLLFADREGSLDKMRDLCRRLRVVSVRVHAHSAERLPPFGQELRRLWMMAGDNGLAVQLHFRPRFATGFEPLIREFSKTRVIIDHMGRPFQGTPDEHRVVMRWSRFDNTVIKLSSLPDADTASDEQIAAVVRRLSDAWGADRMIFGDSFGADTTADSYRQAFERARSYLADLTAEEQAKVLGGTAARLFGFAASQDAR